MLQSLLAVNSTDWLVLILFALIGLRNAWAFLSFGLMLAWLALYIVCDRNFYCFINTSCIYFMAGHQRFIKIPSYFHFAFTSLGAIYFLGAIDQFLSYHFEIDTKFDTLQPFLITAVNAYLLVHLLGGWRRVNVHGYSVYCAKCSNWYKLHQIRLLKIPAQKGKR